VDHRQLDHVLFLQLHLQPLISSIAILLVAASKRHSAFVVAHTNDQCVFFDKFHLTFNFESRVSLDIFKNKNECQLTSKLSSNKSPQCHIHSSMCHFNFQSANSLVIFFLHKSHYISKSKLCVSIDVLCFWVQVFACQMAKTLSKIHTADDGH